MFFFNIFLYYFYIISGTHEDFASSQGLMPLVGHSLSWKNEKDSTVGPNNKLVAKIWIPSDPRESANNDKATGIEPR